MLKNLHEKLFGKNRRRGFTLLEVVTVVGVVVIMCAIAIPTIVSQERTTKYKQHNDYAQSIFMAAQANLSQMRSQGRLGQLQKNGEYWPSGLHPFLGRSGYAYVTSKESDAYSYQRVLPEGSIDSVVRDQAVIIEFDPATGNVYSVFYSEDKAIFDVYDGYENPNSGLPRNDTEKGKQQMVGYYQGNGVGRYPISEDAPISVGDVQFEHKDGLSAGSGNACLTFQIPMAGLGYDKFFPGLDVRLDIFGESGGSFVLKVLERGVTKPDYVKITHNATTIFFEVLFDSSLALIGGPSEANPSFVNHVAYNYSTPANTLIGDASRNWAVKPGDNISVIVHANFTPGDGVKQVDIVPAGIENINPMFGGLVKLDAEGNLKTYKKDTNGENILPEYYQLELLGNSNPAVVDKLYERHKANLELVHPSIRANILKVKISTGVVDFATFDQPPEATEGGV